MTSERSSTHSFDWQLACKVGVEKAILIGNFQFWISENEKRKSAIHFQQGEYWTYDSAKGLAEKYPYFNEKSISRWTNELIESGWLKKDRFNKNSLDKTNWYGRGKLMVEWFLTSIPQNKESVPQNDTSTPQNEETIAQNEGSVPQNEGCNIKDTVINPFQTTVINQQPALADDAVEGDEDSVIDSKKNEGEGPTPNPLPTADDVRVHLMASGPHYRHASERLKLVITQTDYLDLIELFIEQQEMKLKEGSPLFPEMHRVKEHFMNWLNKRPALNQPQNGNTRTPGSSKRASGTLRPTSIGVPDYRGKGSNCDVEL